MLNPFFAHIYTPLSLHRPLRCRWDLACLGWTFFAATGDSTRTADVNLGFYQPFPYILMASCGYTRIPVIVNGCFYRHCFYGLLCTLSIAVPAGLFCGLMGWLYVDVKLMAWLFTYFPSRWLGPCIWSSFTWYLFLDIPYSVGDKFYGNGMT